MAEEKTENQTEEKATSQEESADSQTAEAAQDAGAAAEAAPEAEKKEQTPEERIAALEKENADLKDQLLRRAADFDNYRKRMMKEKQDTYDYANAGLLGDLLDSLDNFDRTIDEDKYGLVGYGKEGDEFNPDEHEAIGRMEDEKAKKETLAQVYLKGYKLKDKVIRHAKVMVKVPKQ